MSATIEVLERRRRWTVRGALIGLALPAIGWPLAMRFGEGSETSETIGGAVLLAGLGVGVWRSLAEVTQARRVDRAFRPQLGAAEVAAMKERWAEAVKRA